jgi:hypothetical protein
MRYPAILTLLVVLALSLGACGGEDSGTGGDGPGAVPGVMPGPAPSGDVPSAVDTTGMTREQLEAKVEEVERLIEAKTDEMRVLTLKRTPGSIDLEIARQAEQYAADLRALTAQLRTYDQAIDALDR